MHTPPECEELPQIQVFVYSIKFLGIYIIDLKFFVNPKARMQFEINSII